MTATTRLAVTEADYAKAGALMAEYVAALPFELTFQDFDTELASLAAQYGGNRGAALLVEMDGAAVGVCAVGGFDGAVCELKRMYLKDEMRGRGLGRHLADHAIAAARRLGYQRIRLDTVDELAAANEFYRSMGFVEIEPYRHNPQPDARFFELDLNTHRRPGPVAVVLIGGSSARMGSDKPSLRLGDMSMLDRVVDTLAATGLDVATAGRGDDPRDMAGPLAGLVGAMRRHPGADVFLTAADQPYLRAATVQSLLEFEGAAVVPVDERPQTTCALYRDAIVPALERFAADHPQGSLQRVVDGDETTFVPPDTWRSWGEDGRSWRSLDTPEEFRAAVDAWPEPPG